MQTAGTSSSRHLHRAVDGDPRPNFAEDFRDDQDVRMGEPFPLTRAASPRPSPLADGHAKVTVPLRDVFRQNLTIAANGRQRLQARYSFGYWIVIRQSTAGFRLVAADS